MLQRWNPAVNVWQAAVDSHLRSEALLSLKGYTDVKKTILFFVLVAIGNRHHRQHLQQSNWKANNNCVLNKNLHLNRLKYLHQIVTYNSVVGYPYIFKLLFTSSNFN